MAQRRLAADTFFESFLCALALRGVRDIHFTGEHARKTNDRFRQAMQAIDHAAERAEDAQGWKAASALYHFRVSYRPSALNSYLPGLRPRLTGKLHHGWGLENYRGDPYVTITATLKLNAANHLARLCPDQRQVVEDAADAYVGQASLPRRPAKVAAKELIHE